MQLLEYFPELEAHDFEDMSIGLAAYNTGNVTSTPKPEADEDITSTPKPDTATTKSQRNASVQPNKKSRSKGRSGGEKSSRTIKALRAQANEGDIEAAMKLGWGVDRITELFNEKKAAKGEKVTPGQPIDDPDLLARIADKHKYQAEIQKKRQEKLRVRAYAGDWDAAKKLKMGKKRMEELFPHMKEGIELEQEAGGAMEDENERERTPAEPFDFERERLLQPKQPTPYGMGEMVLYASTMTPTTAMNTNDYIQTRIESDEMSPWQAAPEPNTGYMQCQLPPPPRYPIYPVAPQQFDPERALRREYDAAMQQTSIAQANLMRIKQELEKVQAAKTQNPIMKRKQVKIEEGGPKNLLLYKKVKKERPSNFPEDHVEKYPDGRMQTPGFAVGVF